MPSLTHTAASRVRPVFGQLQESDPTGASWLGPLVRLGSRVAELPELEELGDLGELVQPPAFDFAVPPPLDYLEYLIKTPHKLKWPRDADGELRKYRPSVNQRRKWILAGNVPAQQEAIRDIRELQAKGYDANVKDWWVLEGATSVDCALLTDRFTLFVEGKRDEKSLKVHTNWYERRIQLYRNLDALRAMPNRTEHYGLLAIVEEGTPIHREAIAMHRDLQFARSSWPHLDDAGITELWSHFLGFTTWQRLAAEFPAVQLPE
jgi:hypothetical protein